MEACTVCHFLDNNGFVCFYVIFTLHYICLICASLWPLMSHFCLSMSIFLHYNLIWPGLHVSKSKYDWKTLILVWVWHAHSGLDTYQRGVAQTLWRQVGEKEHWALWNCSGCDCTLHPSFCWVLPSWSCTAEWLILFLRVLTQFLVGFEVTLSHFWLIDPLSATKVEIYGKGQFNPLPKYSS